MLLNKHNLAIADLASKEESRYTLSAISVTNKWTATTNGHYLVTVSLPEAEDKNFPSIEGFTPTNGATPPFLLHRDDALAIAKAIPKSRIPVLNHASVGMKDEQLQVAVTDLDTHKVFEPVKQDGQFPNIEAVIPRDDAATLTIGLDAEYLMKLAKSALKTCGDGREVTLKIQIKDEHSGVKMTAHNGDTGQEWMAVLMPKRI